MELNLYYKKMISDSSGKGKKKRVTHRICGACEEDLPASSFEVNKVTGNPIRKLCEACRGRLNYIERKPCVSKTWFEKVVNENPAEYSASARDIIEWYKTLNTKITLLSSENIKLQRRVEKLENGRIKKRRRENSLPSLLITKKIDEQIPLTPPPILPPSPPKKFQRSIPVKEVSPDQQPLRRQPAPRTAATAYQSREYNKAVKFDESESVISLLPSKLKYIT